MTTPKKKAAKAKPKPKPDNPVELTKPIKGTDGQDLNKILLNPITLADELAVMRSSGGDVLELAGLLADLQEACRVSLAGLRSRLEPKEDDAGPVREALLTIIDLLNHLDKHGSGLLESLKTAAQAHDRARVELLWVERLTGLKEEILGQLLVDDYRRVQAVLGSFFDPDPDSGGIKKTS